MKTIALSLAALASLGAVAAAQEERTLTLGSSSVSEERSWSSLAEMASRDQLPSLDSDPESFPRSLAAPEGGLVYTPFSLGASGGYLRAKGSDKGTWFGGVQARLRMGLFAVEASVQVHENEYENGDVLVTQYPVQLTAFLYPLPDGPFRPYILGGVGWYYTHIDYRGVFSALSDHTDNFFGEHFGAGAELFLGDRVSLDADVRYIFQNPTTDQVIGRDFNYWQITLGVNFFF